MSDPQILLTNDDGIRADGLRVMYDALSSVGDVTVVAPQGDRSGTGRTLSYGTSDTADSQKRFELSEDEHGRLSYQIPFTECELGYSVDGNPCDCVIAGVYGFSSRPDIVVSGCNPGANIGIDSLTRSGTVNAATEAAHLGVPSIAISTTSLDGDSKAFAQAERLIRHLVAETLVQGVFDTLDYLNVVIPSTKPDCVKITEPTAAYKQDAERTDTTFRIYPKTLGRVLQSDWDGAPAGTDQQALANGCTSVTPLTLPYQYEPSATLREVTEAYQPMD